MPYKLSFVFIFHVILLVTDYIFQLIIINRKYHGFVVFRYLVFLAFTRISNALYLLQWLYASDLLLANNFTAGTSSLSWRFIILEPVYAGNLHTFYLLSA